MTNCAHHPAKKRENTKLYCLKCEARRSSRIVEGRYWKCNTCGTRHYYEGGEMHIKEDNVVSSRG